MMAKKKYTVHPDCQPFVALVEEFLQRRQQDLLRHSPQALSGGEEWGPRTWTQTELEDMVYSSYKPMRQGRVTRPPRREVVMEIANYLNCTLEERNHLLLSAAAAPVAPYLTGQPLAEALAVAQGVAQGLTLPALIINRDWHIHYINEPMLALNGLTYEQLALIPPEQFNFLRLMFDPQLPLYPHLIQNPTSWARMARQTVYGFKMANLLCQFEPWYQALLQQFEELPQFAEHWATVAIDKEFGLDETAHKQPAAVTVESVVTAGRPQPVRAWLRPILISVGYFQFDFPQIIAILPADEQSRLLFGEMGLGGL